MLTNVDLALLIIVVIPVYLVSFIMFTALGIAVRRLTGSNQEASIAKAVKKKGIWFRVLFLFPIVYSRNLSEAASLVISVLAVQAISALVSRIVHSNFPSSKWPLVEGMQKQLLRKETKATGRWED